MGKFFEERADAPIETTRLGGKHSKVECDWSLVPWDALAPVNIVLVEGAKKYGIDNWRRISWQENWNHAMHHLIAARASDDVMTHLTHAACRILFTIATYLTQADEE